MCFVPFHDMLTQPDQVLDDFGSRQHSVVVFIDRVFQHFHQGLSFRQVPPETHADFIIQQLAQYFQGNIFVFHPFQFQQQIFGKDGNIRFFYTRRIKNIHNLIGNQRTIGWICIVNTGPVLGSLVISLTIKTRRINSLKIKIQ